MTISKKTSAAPKPESQSAQKPGLIIAIDDCITGSVQSSVLQLLDNFKQRCKKRLEKIPLSYS